MSTYTILRRKRMSGWFQLSFNWYALLYSVLIYFLWMSLSKHNFFSGHTTTSTILALLMWTAATCMHVMESLDRQNFTPFLQMTDKTPRSFSSENSLVFVAHAWKKTSATAKTRNTWNLRELSKFNHVVHSCQLWMNPYRMVRMFGIGNTPMTVWPI